MSGDGQNYLVSIWSRGGLEGPFGGFLELAQTHESHRPGAQHTKQKRVEGAQVARVVGRSDGDTGITRLAMDKGKAIVAKREVRTEFHRLFQLAQGFVLAAAQ